MKKFGFTIAEIVITLSIVAVAAVISMSAVTNVFPDKNKLKVLNYHAKLGNVITSILNDEDLYHPYTIYETIPNTNLVITRQSCQGLACINNDNGLSEIQGRLGLNGTSGPDNSTWTFTDSGTGGYVLTIDMDSNKAGSTVFSADTNIRNVDSFIFNIDSSGSILPGDALTDAYLRNPLNANDRKADLAAATALLSKYTKQTSSSTRPSIKPQPDAPIAGTLQSFRQ